MVALGSGSSLEFGVWSLEFEYLTIRQIHLYEMVKHFDPEAIGTLCDRQIYCFLRERGNADYSSEGVSSFLGGMYGMTSAVMPPRLTPASKPALAPMASTIQNGVWIEINDAPR